MSTEKFLRLLRQGDYSLILRWLAFLEEHYTLRPEDFSADNIIPFMVFELSNHDFSLDDMSQIEILNAVINSPGSYLPGKMECAVTFLISAALQYQVYEEYQLISFYQTSDPLDGKGVQRWMARDNGILDNKANSDAIQIKSDIFQTTALKYQSDVNKIKDNIFSVVACQNLSEEYLYMLGKLDNSDHMVALRTGVVQALHDYLQVEFLFTARLAQKLIRFLDTLRTLAPQDWEEDYLSGFFEQSSLQRLRMEISRRFRFFTVQIFEHFISSPGVERILANDEENLLLKIDNKWQ